MGATINVDYLPLGSSGGLAFNSDAIWDTAPRRLGVALPICTLT